MVSLDGVSRMLIVALLALGGPLLAGCAGNGTVIADGQRCTNWLHGNGRDAYLAAHGLHEYDAGGTGRIPVSRVIGDLLDQYCSDQPSMLLDEALRRSADRAAGGVGVDPLSKPAPQSTNDPRPTSTGVSGETNRTDGP